MRSARIRVFDREAEDESEAEDVAVEGARGGDIGDLEADVV